MGSQPQAVPARGPSQPTTTQEYSIRVPKDINKRFNVMRFNRNLKVDFKEWKGKSIKMERENNMKSFKEVEEDMPKFGAGSEFGREAREEARRKKYGVASKQYKSEDQPWILKIDGKNGKKFKGIREGGVSENAAYYVFTHGATGTIEAFPLKEWYNFQPVQRYKALSAEEAEEEFSRRNKVMNYFSLMLKKRLRNDEDGEEDDLLEGEKGKKPSGKKKSKDFKISEMDEWEDEEEEDDSGSEKNNESEDEDKDKKKKKGGVKKKKKQASDSEAFEESDDGDEEGRECDYISDSSASESELENQKEMKSVAEEDALRKLLASDDEDEEEEEKKDDEDKNEEEEDKDKDDKDKDKGKSNEKKKDKKKKDGSDSSSEGESPSVQNKDKDDKKPSSTQSSRSVTPTVASTSSTDTLKRPANNGLGGSQIKKPKLDSLPSSSYIYGSSESGITEDAVRRYLMRKPMTTTELLQKFKSKKTGLTSDQIVHIMTKILKNLNPASQKIKGKMYFSITKPQPYQQSH